MMEPSIPKRTLLLMRHAKSSWADAGMKDFDRPLNGRGRWTAPKMAEWMVENHVQPDFMLSSTAIRAQQTLELVCERLNYRSQIRHSPSLYLASPDVMISEIAQTDEQFMSVLLIAHNPGLEMLVNKLVTGFHALPTAAIAWIECHGVTWQDAVLSGKCDLIQIAIPKEID